MTDAPWHARTAADALAALQADGTRGLDPAAVAGRRASDGPNRLDTGRTPGWWTVLQRQFRSALVGILAAAALVAFVLGEPLDGGVILGILVLNGLLGFVQERRAERAIESLARLLAPTAQVVRAGQVEVVPAEDLVPGDLIRLETGDRVPADARLLEAWEVRADESALTGESASVAKGHAAVAADADLAERSSCVWAGTTITHGHANGLVVATGMRTQFGRIAALTQTVTRETTVLEMRMATLGRTLGLLGLVTALLVALLGAYRGLDAFTILMTGLALAVAVVPEGLPAVVTITLALGVRRMARRQALPRRLTAVETLGSATAIVTDKTGTLTAGEMTLRHAWLPRAAFEVDGIGYEPVGTWRQGGQAIDVQAAPDLLALLEAGERASRASLQRLEGIWQAVGEPTEAALVAAARKAGLRAPATRAEVELPFTSERRRAGAVHRDADGRRLSLKGAPEVILERVRDVRDGTTTRLATPADLMAARAAYQDHARRGFRTLAVATRSLSDTTPVEAAALETDLELLGLVAIQDPPRPGAAEAVRTAHAAGIQVLMATGDAPETAQAIARDVGLGAARTLVGRDLDALDDTALDAALRGPVVLARATPEQKLRVVRRLEARGEVVAMTGDGVNDAPALKEADVGVAMGRRGTDVAREAADLVLADDDFATLVDAIEEGRREFENIRKFIGYLLGSNVGEVVALLLGMLVGGPLLLLPVQILWVNVVTDALTAIALGLEPAEHDLMRRPPRPRNARMLGGREVRRVLLAGAWIGLVVWWLFDRHGGPLAEARTIAFTGLVLLEQVNLLAYRTLRVPVARIGWFSNPWLLVAVVLAVGLQALAVYAPPLQALLGTVPIALSDWLLALALGLPLFVVPEIVKFAGTRRSPR